MGGKRYWNKLKSEGKKFPNPHKVYSLSVPEHIIKRTNWEKGDNIGFQLLGDKKRASIELVNLTKENKPYANLTFIRLQQQHQDFIKKITPKNIGNFSKSIQKILLEEMKHKIRKTKPSKKEEKEKKIKEEKRSSEIFKSQLKKDISHLKKEKKIRTKNIKTIFDREIKEKQKQLENLRKSSKTP